MRRSVAGILVPLALALGVAVPGTATAATTPAPKSGTTAVSLNKQADMVRPSLPAVRSALAAVRKPAALPVRPRPVTVTRPVEITEAMLVLDLPQPLPSRPGQPALPVRKPGTHSPLTLVFDLPNGCYSKPRVGTLRVVGSVAHVQVVASVVSAPEMNCSMMITTGSVTVQVPNSVRGVVDITTKQPVRNFGLAMP